jgi:DNA-binding NarL/FixJ family response regulator
MGDPAVTNSILLVDDHPAVLMGLECMFAAEPDFEVVGAVQDPREAAAAFVRSRPDLVVLDLSMPGYDGEEVMRDLRAAAPDCRVLVLTSSVDPETVRRVVRAGADGYQLKDSPSPSLLEAARSVLRGESPVDPRVTRSLLATGERDGLPALTARDRDDLPGLTERERDVLRLVAQGLANKQIASRLGIGVSTVKTHLSSVFQQIDVTDRTSAALWAHVHLGPRTASDLGRAASS